MLSVQNAWAVTANEVATIDLSMALSLHPKMSLFDFNRIGFYKVEFGLTEQEFKSKIAAIRASAPDRTDELNNLEKQIEEIHKEREKLSSYYVGANDEKLIKAEELMKASIDKEKEINDKILEINHQTENYDLTSPKETLAIISEIEKDIFDAIDQVAKENNFSVVLNSTIPIAYSYEKNYINGEIYGQGIPGINFMLFYSFLAKNNLDNPLDDIPPSRDLINWLELTRYPKAINILPMKPYPLVLTGGKSILSLVVKKIYDKYEVDPAVYNVVDSIIIKIEQLQNGKPVEQRTIKY